MRNKGMERLKLLIYKLQELSIVILSSCNPLEVNGYLFILKALFFTA